jgi:phosphoribosylformylglycinamidine cyclo-ligase
VPRCLPDELGAEIDRSTWEPSPIFRLIESKGVREDEMWRTFNMGIGMVLVLREGEVPALMRALDGSDARVIGKVVPLVKPERVRIV